MLVFYLSGDMAVLTVTMHDHQLENFGWPYENSLLFGMDLVQLKLTDYDFNIVDNANDFSTSCYDNWNVCEQAEDNSSFPIHPVIGDRPSYPHIFKRKLLKNLINYAKIGDKGYISIKNLDYSVGVYLKFSHKWSTLTGVRLPGLDEITPSDHHDLGLFNPITCPATPPWWRRHSKHNTKGLKALDVSVNRVRVYPNPSQTGQLTLGIASVTSGNMLFYIRDIQGNVHLKKKVHVEEGTQKIKIKAALKKGVYFLEVNSNDLNSQQMILIE
tara:strand:+ start:2299 stop:3111 length:813 start_codon:yes stop_codon:yes gene_type:complete